eukprot:3452575-Pyramimonas_sp.AAC.1
MAYRVGPPSTSYQNRSLDNYFEHIIQPLQDLGYQVTPISTPDMAYGVYPKRFLLSAPFDGAPNGRNLTCVIEVDVFLTFYRMDDFDYNTHWVELEERLKPKMITVMPWEDSKQLTSPWVHTTTTAAPNIESLRLLRGALLYFLQFTKLSFSKHVDTCVAYYAFKHKHELPTAIVAYVSARRALHAHANMMSFTAFNMYCLAVQRVYNLVVATRYDLLFKVSQIMTSKIQGLRVPPYR